MVTGQMGRTPRRVRDGGRSHNGNLTSLAVAGGELVYDPMHEVQMLHGCKKLPQFGGLGDALTRSYDVRSNTWTNLGAKNRPGNPWVGAMGFDPGLDVCVLFNFKDKKVWANRHKAVNPGRR